jgi:serine protease Do
MKKIFPLLFVLGAGIVLGLALSAKWPLFIFNQTESSASAQENSPNGIKIEDAVIRVAETTGKAVVSISTEYTTIVRMQRRAPGYYPFAGSPFAEDEFFRRFFDEFFGGTQDTELRQAGLGSGVIIEPAGYILTNEHVVGNADKITVTLADGRQFKGLLRGKDERSDLAIIKIEAEGLPSAKLGDSDKLKIGQWVVAIGNPFAFALQNPEPTVTSGVISALHRSLGRLLAQERDYQDLIQTDAAINPGNSGGPLVNLKGEIVGINVAIVSTSGGYQGLGFAIPVNKARRIISQLIAGKKISYGWLGVTVQDLNEDLAKYFGLADKKGAVVISAMAGSPAFKAGIKEGDVIKEIDNKKINNVRELLDAVGRLKPGNKAKLKLVREKKELTLEAEVGERPQTPLAAAPVSVSETEGAPYNWRGLKLADLTAEILQRLRLPQVKGVAVLETAADSPAEGSGIVPLDVIIELNKVPVTSLAEFKQIAEGASGNCLLRTLRGYFLVRE